MSANEHCFGLNCRFAQIGETTVYFDDPRFKDCEDVLTGSPDADPSVAYYEGFVGLSTTNRERCGYAAKMILKASEGVHNA